MHKGRFFALLGGKFMEKELEFYERIGNWDFSKIKYHEEILEDEFNYYDWVKRYVNENVSVLDLGTGGAEVLLKNFPKAKRIVGIDFSKEMIKTANNNLEESKRKNENISFMYMNINELQFDENEFDVITARHTVLNVNEIKIVLKPGGILIIEGVAKDDCLELKDKVGRGQCYFDEKAIEDIEYDELTNANFDKVEKKYMLLNEWYHSEDDFYALLFKTPIIENINENDLIKINEYIEENTSFGNIKLLRKIYGFVVKNIK